jgi:hypothetical protein
MLKLYEHMSEYCVVIYYFRIEKRNLSEANGFDFRRQKSPSSV